MSGSEVDHTIFSPVTPHRISDSTAEQIKHLIAEGKLCPGDRLPSERNLIRLLKVSRTALREGLRELETTGIIEVTPGLGRFVSPLAALSEGFSPWEEWFHEHPNEVWELLELAEVTDPLAAALAANRATEEEIEAILAAVDQMREAIEAGDIPGIVAADIAFHEAVSLASHNKYVVEINENLSITADARYSGFRERASAEESLRTHSAVAQGIRARDPQAAKGAMLEHIKKAKVAVLRAGMWHKGSEADLPHNV